MERLLNSETLDLLGTTFAGVSILLVFYQIRKNLKWNQKKCAEEALTRFSSGDFFKYIHILESDFKWDILKEDVNYGDIIKNLDGNKRRELDDILKDIFRYLETITIKIEHGVIDEEVCFDYLFSVLTNLHIKCEQFVKNIREKRKEPRMYEHVSLYGDKWHKRCLKESKAC